MVRSDPMMRDDDVNLPWQYVLLGFFIFGALFAAPILIISLIPGQFHDRDVWWIRAETVVYLSIGLGATPWLLRTGRRRFRNVNPDGRTFGGALRQPPPRMSRGKRLAFSSFIFVVGLLATLGSYSLAPSGGVYTVFIGAMGVGLIGVTSSLLSDSD